MDTIFEIQRIKQEVTETNKYQITHITSPMDTARLGTEIIGDEDREVLLVIVLNTKSKVVAIHRCHIGALNSTVIHPREIFKSAILNNGASLIVILIGMEFSRRNNKSLCFQRYIIFASFFVAKITNSKDKTEIILVKDLYYTSNELNNLT
ncbi:JAB domain-containing protein [Niallia circulans]|uniref:JAB domain-containing protein n=1 Tax=Niallia circulans TaxID=1397 RepID=UPI001F32785E|nr:JAB domain-containing protein [Niallia circulans]MCF2650770.1 hypothetical protein [Niallia circulans]